MTKRFRIPAIVLVLAMLLCACAEIPPASSEPSSASSELPPVSSESAEPSVSPDPTPTEAVSPTPVPTATPIPTKKPTATPTAKPTIAARPQGGTPEYLKTYPFGSVEALRDFILTGDIKTFQKGHYASMVSRIKDCGYFIKPIFTDEIPFSTLSGAQIAFALSEDALRGLGVGYRVSYKNTDAFVSILDITQDQLNEVKENLYAYELAVDTREVGFDKEDAIRAGYKQTTLTVESSVRDTWGKLIYGQGGRVDYRIWFLLDDSHLVSVDWFSTDAAAAEEFVSKLEFEKVELEPVTEAPEPTLPAGKVTPTPAAETTPEAEKITQ